MFHEKTFPYTVWESSGRYQKGRSVWLRVICVTGEWTTFLNEALSVSISNTSKAYVYNGYQADYKIAVTQLRTFVNPFLFVHNIYLWDRKCTMVSFLPSNAGAILMTLAISLEVCSSTFLKHLPHEDRLAAMMLMATEPNGVVHEPHYKESGRTTNEVCFDELGCFKKSPIGALPEAPDSIPPLFRLYIKVRINCWWKYSHNWILCRILSRFLQNVRVVLFGKRDWGDVDIFMKPTLHLNRWGKIVFWVGLSEPKYNWMSH